MLIRVPPGIDAGTHRAITTGTEDQKFGLSIDSGAAIDAVLRVLEHPGLELVGVHCHLGSQVSLTAPYVQAARRVIGFLADVRALTGHVLAELNLGGGHAIAYLDGDPELPPDVLAPLLDDAVDRACRAHGLPRPRLTVEPGRAIAGPCGVTVYEVLTVKHARDRTWVAVDGGMTDNPRPALYGARYTVALVGRHSQAQPGPMTIVGRHCESGDVLVEHVELPSDLTAGDLLAVPATGAYHHSMGSNYNLTPRPPLVAVEDGRARLLVRRETLEDLFARDVG